MKKFEIQGAAIICTDTETNNVILFEPKLWTWINKQEFDENQQISFVDVNNVPYKNQETIFLSEAVDSEGTPFTEQTFALFISENLGKTSGGSGPEANSETFTVESNNSLTVPAYTLSDVITGLEWIGTPRGFEIDPINNAVKNISGEPLNIVGQVAFHINRSSGGGTTIFRFFSERSSDNGVSWTQNANSLRNFSIGRDGIDYKSGFSFTDNAWNDGDLIRFRFSREGRSVAIEPVSANFGNGVLTSHSFIWHMKKV